MEKYILKILENNNRVIVPEFGAFIVKQRDPLTIVFNEFLQYNDGMLVDSISKSENISRDDAKVKIDAFVADVTKAIEKDSAFPMSKLGIIKKSSTGKISIEQGTTPTQTTKKESKPVSKTTKPKDEKKSATKPDIDKETPKKDNEIPKEVIPPIATDELKDQESKEKDPPEELKKKDAQAKTTEGQVKPSESKPETKSTDQKKPEATEPKKDQEKQVQKPSAEKKIDKPTPVKKAEPAPQPKPIPVLAKDTQKQKRTKIILWIVIIVVVNAIIISIFIFKGDIGSILHSKADGESINYLENEILLPELPTEDASLEESIQPEEVIPEITPEATTPAVTPPPKTISGTRYYIIAGAFQNEQNADNLVIELKTRGYNSEKIGKKGNLHLVSYDVFQTKADADRSLRKIKKEVNPDAWVRIVK